MQASLFFILELVEKTFQYNIRFIWFSDSHHLDVIIAKSNYFWKGEFAYFTLKFGEVIGGSDSVYLFFDFAVDPSAKAVEMYHTTAALTFAGRY
jgi:hypothetical protein